ncbi:lasso peptide biosynthesis B2 protein [Sphingomonas nostoxanthinifaciens]|uniref:lasso peptide biosynthesis B2 protein n=1 Tax=Sphingomonas nostoxanthinifaciens TaxID=2872652 RepID=UPI001CC1C7F2|nr:lasso peptide biosynthesis B2 protein [Sphingomonas nostoxanthinifaciens]UAK25470.1 lasso peptide biosynthesis B2 protein [Sphingomonas nostoxanthinifaciens]
MGARSEARMLEATCREGTVFLDIEGDAYACRYDPLPRSAYCEADAPAAAASVSAVVPWVELEPLERVTVRLTDVRRFLHALARATWIYRTHSFARMIQRFERTGIETRGSADSDRLALTVACFELLTPWLPFKVLCLFRSLFLLEFLRLCDVRAEWIFGVALFPFEAHCWVAAGGRLVGERAHRVERFEIMLALPRRV